MTVIEKHFDVLEEIGKVAFHGFENVAKESIVRSSVAVVVGDVGGDMEHLFGRVCVKVPIDVGSVVWPVDSVVVNVSST